MTAEELSRSGYQFQYRLALAHRNGRGWTRGVTITNCRRSPTQNASAGGQPFSQHLAGLACDFVWPGPPYSWPVAAFATSMRGVGLVVIDERNRPGYRPHIHVQRFPATYWSQAGAG